MRTLAFFPWFDLESEYAFRDFTVLPYRRGEVPGRTPEEQEAMDDVLKFYHAAHGRPVDRAAILQHDCQCTPTTELNADFHADLFVFADLLAFAGLAERRFFSHSHYCNRDTYRLVLQEFADTGKKVVVTSRRRDGASNVFYDNGVYGVRCPEHITRVHPLMDSRLMTALLEATTHDDWPALYQAITLFNEANTDRNEVPIATEVIFTYAALEHVLHVPGKLTEKVAEVLEKTLKPSEPLPRSHWFIPKENQRAVELLSKSSSLRSAWLQDFANSRGSLAHGHALGWYPARWLPQEHLLYGAHVVPLLIKQSLDRMGVYQMTDADKGGIDAFEPLLNVRHFESPFWEETSEHPWHTILKKHRVRILFSRNVVGDRTSNGGGRF